MFILGLKTAYFLVNTNSGAIFDHKQTMSLPQRSLELSSKIVHLSIKIQIMHSNLCRLSLSQKTKKKGVK